MERVQDVAKRLNRLYQADNDGERIDEMRLHKLLYFVQRESLLRTGEPMFEDEFEGWKYGPVIRYVRNAYAHGVLFEGPSEEISEEAADMIQFVYDRYKKLSPWKLSLLSHGEYSWRNAREGLTQDQNGSRPLSLLDIRLDAAREKLRRDLEARTA
ncbi:MAG: SocA family protein [Clostridia bacterium]|nr:SocA family protein [Clostridia bacterium]